MTIIRHRPLSVGKLMQLFRFWRVRPALSHRLLKCSFQASKIWKLLGVIHVLLHDEDGRVLLKPDLHCFGLLAVYPKSELCPKCCLLVIVFLPAFD